MELERLAYALEGGIARIPVQLLIPLACSRRAPLVAFFDLNPLWEILVVGRWEWAMAAGILPSPPALKRMGNECEARLIIVVRSIV